MAFKARVRSTVETGHFRAGLHWPAEGKEVDLEELGREAFTILDADPRIVMDFLADESDIESLNTDAEAVSTGAVELSAAPAEEVSPLQPEASTEQAAPEKEAGKSEESKPANLNTSEAEGEKSAPPSEGADVTEASSAKGKTAPSKSSTAKPKKAD